MEMERYEVLKWEIDDKKLKEWRCLDEKIPRNEAGDCAINTLSFFGLLDRETAELVASQKNSAYAAAQTPGERLFLGTPTYEVTDHLFNISDLADSYIKKNFKFFFFPLDREHVSFYLKDKIPRGYGTLINLYRPDPKGGHTLIFAVDLRGESIFLDPQQMQTFVGEESINKMLQDQEYNRFALLYASAKNPHNRTEVRYSVRKPKSDEPPSKKQRTAGAKKRKTKRKNFSKKTKKNYRRKYYKRN